MSIYGTLKNNFGLKKTDSAMKPSSNYDIFIVYQYA